MMNPDPEDPTCLAPGDVFYIDIYTYIYVFNTHISYRTACMSILLVPNLPTRCVFRPHAISTFSVLDGGVKRARKCSNS